MRGSRAALVALLVGLAAANLAVTFARSTIPLAFDGTVRVERRLEHRPGADDVFLLAVRGRTLHVDDRVARRLEDGERVEKEAWSRTIRTPRGPVTLSPSRDFWGMLATMPVALLSAWVAFFRRGDAPGSRPVRGDRR